MDDRGETQKDDPYRESSWGQILVALAATGLVGLLWLFVPEFPVVPAALATAFFFLVISFRFPFIPCLLFVIFSFLRIHEAFPMLSPLRLPQALAQVSLLVILWHVVLARNIKAFMTKELTAFLVFFAICTITVVTAINRPDAASLWIDNFSKVAIMTFAIAWMTRTPGDFHFAARLLVLAGTAVASVAIYNSLHGIGLVEGTRVTVGRDIGSLLGDPNDLSLALLFPTSFAAALVVSRTGWLDKILGVVGFVTLVVAIIFTQSRGGLLGLAAMLGVVAFRVVKNKMILIVAAVILVPTLYVAAGISGRSSGGSAEQGIDESSQGRLVAWEAAWNMAKSRPLFGVGIANFVGNYFEFTPEWDGKNHAVHSTWFGVLAETGFLGFGAFVTMVVLLARLGWRCLKTLAPPSSEPRLQMASLALFGGFVSFCVSGTFLTQGLAWPVYILLALTVGLSHSIRQQASDQMAAFSGATPLRPTARPL